MRICLLGEFDVELDEAMRKTAFYLYEHLSRENEVLILNPRDILSFKFWTDLINFRPSVVHYVSGSSLLSFVILKLVSMAVGSKSIISIMRPTFSAISLRFIKLFKPTILIAQASLTEERFRNLDFNTVFLPVVGVDMSRFNPSVRTHKIRLRRKFNLKPEVFLVLHVGSIKNGRNLKWLSNIQSIENVQVLIVGAVSQGSDKKLLRELKDVGCIIWNRYFEDIENIYALADCYVFPVVYRENIVGKSEADCIDMPLSVIEAMACNLPVITTNFGGLSRVFDEGDGLIFVRNVRELVDAVEFVKDQDLTIKTHDKVKDYSWINISRRLLDAYKKV
ncbi:glycosyltransferase family 4 protein [Methanothermobacter sp. K4]|uniref:glycosyltransferase family 4 protein n=1 Tax=Methanothermobacter sp. K4 TaxID=2913262 RepID=UPI001EDA6586|nr:glycosyltransferase family 4 protein [Methanothermobacter sp. K4]MCG2829230.1 glycosyltransferase family 4 protein [Methanothermobacter sp. K4]